MNEVELLRALQRGDPAAFDAIFRKWAPVLLRFALSKTRNDHEAENIVQESFATVWERHASIDPAANFGGWLMTVARNKIYNIFRRRVLELKFGSRREPPASGEAEVEHDLFVEDLRRALFEGVERLAPLHREILLLKADGWDNAAIAERLGMTKKTLENHIYKAFRRLRTDLSDFRDLLEVLPILVVAFL